MRNSNIEPVGWNIQLRFDLTAQETHARFEAISEAAEEDRRKRMASSSSTISLDSPIIAVCGIKDVRVVSISISPTHQWYSLMIAIIVTNYPISLSPNGCQTFDFSDSGDNISFGIIRYEMFVREKEIRVFT